MVAPAGLVLAGLTARSGQVGIAAELINARGGARFSVGAPQQGCWLLDPVMCGPERIRDLYAQGSRGADLAVITGTGGLFDARTVPGGFVEGTAPGSPAHVAILLGLPVVLVIDLSGMSQTVGAVIKGITSMDTSVRIAGVVLLGWSGETHRETCRSAVEAQGIPVVDDLDGIAALAEHPATGRERGAGASVKKHPDNPVIAVATGTQPEWAYLLSAEGAQVVDFDPRTDQTPDCDGLIITGGIAPDLRTHVASGKPLYVEGLAAGQLAKQLKLDLSSGDYDADVYREAVALDHSLMCEAGQRVIGVDRAKAVSVTSPGWAPMWGWRTTTRLVREGFQRGNVSATSLGIHPAGVAGAVERFVAACAGQVPQ